LNVVVWRLPRGESLVHPPSRCPVCLHGLAWHDNFPIFGWLWLRGRCRYCHTPISAQYPTVEFVTAGLFVLYYVMYFMAGRGPCWVEVRPDALGDLHVHRSALTSMAEHWPQYFLAVFTISCLLAASLIDAKLFWIPQSIPLLMAGVGLLFHALIDRPRQPGALTVQSPVAGALAAGATVGLLIALVLLWTGKLKRSFADGWPELEIDKEPAEPVEAKEGTIARIVRRWMDAYRGALSPEKSAVLKKYQVAATAREKEEAAREKEKADAAGGGLGPVSGGASQAFTASDVRREIRREMVFLMCPLAAGAIAAVTLGTSPVWARLLHDHHWLSGLLGAVLGGLVGGFVVWLTRVLGSMAFGREAMGIGDVDLMFGVGAIVGAGAATVAFFVAPFFGLAIAVYMLVIGKRRELPYGPYLSLGTAFVMIYYCPIAEYLRPGLSAMAQILSGR
jgi:prepilin signal peptidase PulO-like enzyme (type II secretory pathway)